MSKPRVFVTRIIPEAGLARIRAAVDADVWEGPLPPPRDELLKRAAGCQGLVSLLTDRIDAELMDACPDLRVISQYAVGFNNIDVAAATQRKIAVGNTPEVLTDATADMAFCLMLAAGRRLLEGVRAVTSGAWKTWEPTGFIGMDFAGKTLGVIGLGRIGAAFARRCRGAYDMKVLHWSRSVDPAVEREVGAEAVELDDLLARSDVVSIHCALAPETRKLFDARAFARMKPGAVLVNTARGEIVDQEALGEALASGRLLGAGLDVTDPEPLPPSHPLLKHGNVVVAPHIASATVESRNGMAEICADNLVRGLRGEALRCAVNPEVAPRGV